jgi:hypothetical protein
MPHASGSNRSTSSLRLYLLALRKLTVAGERQYVTPRLCTGTVNARPSAYDTLWLYLCIIRPETAPGRAGNNVGVPARATELSPVLLRSSEGSTHRIRSIMVISVYDKHETAPCRARRNECSQAC